MQEQSLPFQEFCSPCHCPMLGSISNVCHGQQGECCSNATHSSLIHTLKVTKWFHKYQLNSPLTKEL